MGDCVTMCQWVHVLLLVFNETLVLTTLSHLSWLAIKAASVLAALPLIQPFGSRKDTYTGKSSKQIGNRGKIRQWC